MLNRWIKKYWWLFVLGFVLIIALAFLITLTRTNPFSKTILLFFNDWSIVLSALTTVILAAVAFWSIREGRRIREEDKLRDIRRFALDKVYLWIKRLSDFGFEMHTPRSILEIYELIREVNTLQFQLFEIKEYANMFEEYFTDLFNIAEEALQKYAKVVSDKLDEIKSLPEPEQKSIFLDFSLVMFWITELRTINVSSNALLKIIADVKIQLKL